MRITNVIPKNWKELQDKVCKLLNEAGYPSESPKEIKTVRGTVEVDVFSTSNDELLNQFICECKFWNVPIPKEKVHAFRTVVGDSGSVLGIVISKKGFQSGAYEAAYCSNVLLKDWDGFIKLIEKQWLKNQLQIVKKIAHPLSVYTDFLDVPLEKLSEKEREIYKMLNENSIESYIICRNLKSSSLYEDNIEVDGITFTAYDELFGYLKQVFTIRIAEYEELFKNNPVEQWKLDCWEHMLIDM